MTQVCALAALTVIKHRLEGKNPIGEADLKWIFARNCEGTEQLRLFMNRILHHTILPGLSFPAVCICREIFRRSDLGGMQMDRSLGMAAMQQKRRI